MATIDRRRMARLAEAKLEGLMTTTTSANPPTPRPHDETASPGPPRRSLYRGDPGMWSWVLHRITGATVFFFLFVHVLDTALVRISPQAYDEVIDTYKTPIVGLMELALVAAVLYHALNGIRIVLIDFWWRGTRYQRLMLWVIGITWVLIMAPATVLMGLHISGRFG
jgi:succinate dehydrogenase / fumarate reductase cytochrome b subunit